ncbi:c-type cytochrome [Flavobacterium sp. HTF]|uniref:c-type cytochrome n=1 Tax=Flavobacterium sp. HTF TaxID=2170732 RepID=UPI00267B0C25
MPDKNNINLKKRIRTILLYSTGFLVFTMLVFYFIYINNKPQQFVCRIPVPEYFCGTQAFPHAVEGKDAFNSVCAACHKLDARSTGPALRNMDSITYVKWIVDRKSKIDTTKFEKFGIDYHRHISREILDSLDIKYLFEYTNREPAY